MPQIYGDKIKGLKELYGFRMMLKAKVVAYKKAIGHELDHGHLKQILFFLYGHGVEHPGFTAGA